MVSLVTGFRGGGVFCKHVCDRTQTRYMLCSVFLWSLLSLGFGWGGGWVFCKHVCGRTQTLQMFCAVFLVVDVLVCLFFFAACVVFKSKASNRCMILWHCFFEVFWRKQSFFLDWLAWLQLPPRGWVDIHTGTIDAVWKELKKHVPTSINNQPQVLNVYVRQFQWRFCHRHEKRSHDIHRSKVGACLKKTFWDSCWVRNLGEKQIYIKIDPTFFLLKKKNHCFTTAKSMFCKSHWNTGFQRLHNE